MCFISFLIYTFIIFAHRLRITTLEWLILGSFKKIYYVAFSTVGR
jgi:hypothetical protein